MNVLCFFAVLDWKVLHQFRLCVLRQESVYYPNLTSSLEFPFKF